MSDFNRIALSYDLIKKLVFRGKLDQASSFYISEIPQKSHILIVGGGTGSILHFIHESHKITYLEASEKMISLAKRKKYKAQTDFIRGTIESFESATQFDAIITPFVLDCFQEEQLGLVFKKLLNQLKIGGVWLHADFYPKSYLQRKFTSIMYMFFQLSTGMKAEKVSDFSKYFQPDIFIEEKKALFLNAMVHSYIYRKIGT